jgi:hypothetical protein
MGAVIRRRDFPAVIERTRQGVFVLGPNVTAPAAAPAVNIGLELGERLYKAKTEGAPVSIANELDSILGEYRRDVTLKNTDVLFSPGYELDVIRLLLQAGRNRRFYLRWPGEVAGERLTYSEPGRFDFKEYNIGDYVDTYIVLR